MRHRTTIGAAEDLGMSQPAVSNAIKLTEVKMGFPLFDRVSNRLVPTEEARILCAEAEPLFLLYQAIQQKAWDLRTGRTGVLRLCATAELSEFLVPKALRQFIGSHPNVKIHVETLRMDAVLDCVEMGISDVGVAINPPSRPGLIQELLIETEMMCISPIDYGLQQQADLTPSDLRGRRLIGPPADSPFRTLLENAFQQSGAHFRPDLEVRFANVASPLVEEGLGIAIVDALTARSGWHAKFVAHGFRPRIALPVCALVRRDKPQQRLTVAFIDHARKLMQELIPPPAARQDTIRQLR